MKNIVLIAILLPLLFSCSKKWNGCTDYVALNFKEKAEKDDGSCIYTSITFYADSANYPGTTINRIDITIDGINIGTFNGAYMNLPDCSNPGELSTRFSIEDAGKVTWQSKTYLTNGTFLTKTGTVTPDSATSCVIVNSL